MLFRLGCAAAILAEVFVLAFMPMGRTRAAGREPTRIEEFGNGAVVTQDFRMGADGFHAIRVQLEASSPTDVEVEWTLRSQPEGQLPGTQRGTFAIAPLSGRRWQSIEFPAIQASEGRTYSLDLRLLKPAPAQGGRGVVALAASKDRPLGHSIVRVDGRERWSDLLFETRAEADTALGRFRMKALPMLPAPLRHMAFVWLVLVGFNALVVAAASAVWSRPSADHVVRSFDGSMVRWSDGSMVRWSDGSMVRWRVPVLAVGVLVLCAWVARVEFGRINLIDRIESADLESSMGLRDGVDIQRVEIGSESHRALFAHTASRIQWHITVPSGGRLDTAVAIHPVAWSGGDGAVFRISVNDGSGARDLFMRHVNARLVPQQRWIPVSVDLSAFAGRAVDLILATEPSLPGRPVDGSYDWTLWAEPRIR